MALRIVPGQLDELLDHLRRLDRPVLVAAQALLQQLGEGARLHHVLSSSDGELALQQLLQQLDREVALRHPAHLGEELVGQHRNVRLVESGGGEDVQHALGCHGPRDDLAHGVVQRLVGPRVAVRALDELGADRLEEPHVVADAPRLLVGYGQGEGLGQLTHAIQAALLAVLLGQDVLLCQRQQSQAFLRRARHPGGPIEAVGTARSTPRTSPAAPPSRRSDRGPSGQSRRSPL